MTATAPPARRTRRGHHPLEVVLVLLLVAGGRTRVAAQGVVVSLPPPANFPAVPRIPVHAVGFDRSKYPLSLVLEVATTADFRSDVALLIAQGMDSTVFTPERALPEQVPLFFRATVLNRFGSVIGRSQVEGPRATTWLTLLTPTGGANVVIYTRFPRFIWQSAPAAIPPGPWIFDLSVENAATGVEVFRAPNLTDTTAELPSAAALEVQTPYRWSVRAHLFGSPADSITVSSSTFVVARGSTPLVVLLYQNFPNPFPSVRSRETCIWFDLPRPGRVRLTVHDLRGNLVRTLVPGSSATGLPADLPAGTYGRTGEGSQSGCDPRLRWDGTDERGRVVPPGLYLLRLQAEGKTSMVKMVFRGS